MDVRHEMVTKDILSKPLAYVPGSNYRYSCHGMLLLGFILEKIKGIPITFIGIEDFFSGKQAISVIKLAILGTMVRSRLLDNGYSYMAFAPTQVKKFETGSGVAPKDTMLKSVFKKHNFDTNSNNIADACAIAYLGKGFYEWQAGKKDFLKYETEVLKKVSKDRKVINSYKLDLDNKVKTKEK
jgi:hypothetical protein